MGRILSSRWCWLAACIVAGATAVTIMDWLVLQEGLNLVDAFAADAGVTPDGPRRYSVAILFGLFAIEDTAYPYLWFALGSALTGGGLGLAVWTVAQAGIWAWLQFRHRVISRPT